MDLVMKLPQMIRKVFTLFINMAKPLKPLLFKSITAGESFYSSQNSSSPEVIEKVGKAVAEGDLQKVIYTVKGEMQNKSRYTVKIAVTGDSGNGMSSFVNALRLIGHEEEDSAPTGVVRTTQKPACYSSSHFPYVELWDLPGTGTTAQSMESYLDEMQFSAYDLIIIIASEQFSSNHVKLAEAMQRMRKRFYVVWTKLDRDISTSTFPEPQLLQSIQKNIRENLQKAQVRDPPIFLVSCFSPSFHDFLDLRKTLRKDIHNIRYRDPLETLSQVCVFFFVSFILSLLSTTHQEAINSASHGESVYNETQQGNCVYREVLSKSTQCSSLNTVLTLYREVEIKSSAPQQ